ncbi:MAG: S9 family peptidase [Candidatus Baltobacteraceae bacterium]
MELSLATISPPGDDVAFVASRANVEENRYDDSLELFERRTGTLRALASGHHTVDALQWSPDGTKLAAVLDVPGADADQIYLVDTASGVTAQLTQGKTSVVDMVWAPDGKSIAFTRREDVAAKRGAAAFEDAFEVSDDAYLRTKAAVPMHVWIADLNGTERRVTSGTWSAADATLSWSPDGQSLLFLRAPNGIHGVQGRARVVRVAVGSGRTQSVTPHLLYEDQPLYSPDGSRVAYLYSRDGDPMNQTEAMVIATNGTQDRDLTRGLDRHVATAAWMPDGASLLVQVYERAAVPLYVQPLRGVAHKLPLGNVVNASIQAQGSIARDGTIAFVGTQERRPNEIYVLEPHATAPRRLTEFNAAFASLNLGRAARIVWHGHDGFEEDGVLTYPPGYVAGRKYPLVLRIHGGPTESSSTAFEPFYQLAASHGYLVFAPNYRGSNDLGNAYEHAIFNDASAGPGRDIMAGIDVVERLGIVDTRRIGVSGWSYGGQMTSWMEGHYTIWKAAVAGAAVNDLVVDYTIADDIDASKIAFASGSPFVGNALETWRAQSPITYFKNIRTPTLILCNVYDVRVPIVESYEMYHALHDNGVPVKFFAYPSTGHLPNGPVRLADAYRRWLAWFDLYLR